jgi:hypothetical protein
VYAPSPMSARRLRAAIVVGAALVLTVGTLAGCSRKSAPDSAAGDTATETTAIAGTSVVPPSSDTTASTAPPEGDPNASSTTLEADDNTDAFGHTPEQVQAFRAAYSAAFEAECRRIWASVGGGLLSDPDFAEDQYSVDDCLGELDPDWGELVDRRGRCADRRQRSRGPLVRRRRRDLLVLRRLSRPDPCRRSTTPSPN